MTQHIAAPEHLPNPFPLEERTLTLRLSPEAWAHLDRWELLDYPPDVVIDTAVVALSGRVDLDAIAAARALDEEFDQQAYADAQAWINGEPLPR